MKMRPVISPNLLNVIFVALIISGCEEVRFQSPYFDFAKEGDALEFKAEIQRVPDHVNENMVYFCRTGVYDNRQVVFKGVSAKSLILAAYSTSDTRVIWNKNIPDHQYIAEIIVPEPEDSLLYSELQKVVNREFRMEVSREDQRIEVLELHLMEGASVGFEETDDSEVRWSMEDGKISGIGLTLGMLSRIMERVTKVKPFFNSIEGNQRYAINLEWEAGNIEDLNAQLTKFGLELLQREKEVEVLLVNPAKSGG